MKIRIVPIDKVVPYARNPRRNAEAVAKVAASIREFGWQQPIVVDREYTVVVGHTRLLAARQLGMAEVPVHVAEGLTEAQIAAYRLADNRVHEEAEWDRDLLRIELGDLQASGFDLALTGFDEDEIAAALAEATEGKTDPDDVPTPPADAASKPGDVWILGRHRLVCGDATNPDDWAKLECGDAYVAFTSPPYNAGDASGLRDRYKPGVPKTRKFYGQYTDDLAGSDYAKLLSDTVVAAFTFVDTIAINVQPLAGSKRPLLQWMNEWAPHLVDVITWDKGRAAPHIQPGIMASRFEWIVILSREDGASRVIPHSSWHGKYSNVYTAPPQSKNEFAAIHGATFPVHLPEFIVGDLMNRCRGVVDCFCGTGTTLIAAERLGRDGRGIELDPSYVDVAVKRWQNFTGNAAMLESDGRTFDQVESSNHMKAA